MKNPKSETVKLDFDPDQEFYKHLVSMGLNFNRRLVNIDISILHQLYPALNESRQKQARDAQLINPYLEEKATISKRIVNLLHQHFKLRRKRELLNDESALERQFLKKFTEKAESESEDEAEEEVENTND